MILRKLHLISAASCLVSLAAQANDIEPEKEFYTANRTDETVVIDGDVSEWRTDNNLEDPKFSIPKGSGDNGTLVTFEPHGGGSWTGPEDQSFGMEVAYDDDNVYVGVIVTDEYHEHAAGSVWNGDALQMMIADATRSSQVGLYNYSLGGVDR